MTHHEEYMHIADQFAGVVPVLQAIGDPTRLDLIMTMLKLPCQSQGGARVGDICEHTHLSRPAVSHHLKILKDAGIVGVRPEGTKNFYYLSSKGSTLEDLHSLLGNIIDLNNAINTEEAH